MLQSCLIFLNDDGIDSSPCSYLADAWHSDNWFSLVYPFCVRQGDAVLLKDKVPKVFLTPSLIVFELEVLLQV